MKINKEYKEITSDIINDEHFIELKDDNHHGSSRYDHCKRVSYLSFLMAKFLKANYRDTAISGLLHDYFHGVTNSNEDISYLTHPNTSIINAKKDFNINSEEEEIIRTHMYHYALVKHTLPFINKREKVSAKEYKPTSKEGYIVCLSDLLVSIYEVGVFKVRYKTCLYFLFLINLINYYGG